MLLERVSLSPVLNVLGDPISILLSLELQDVADGLYLPVPVVFAYTTEALISWVCFWIEHGCPIRRFELIEPINRTAWNASSMELDL